MPTTPPPPEAHDPPPHQGDRKGAGSEDDDDGELDARTAPFGWLSILIIVALVVGTWFLIQKLTADTKMQDCIQSGRRNCAPVEDPRP